MAARHLGRAITGAGLIGIALQPANAYMVLAPNSVVAGMSISDWTAAWWTWSLQSPKATNPFTDPDGGFANLNNDGPVFFVAGTFGTSTANRSFDVPAGKPVLIPVINFVDTAPAEIYNPPVSLADREAVAHAQVVGWPQAVIPDSLFAAIDGNPVANLTSFLEETGFFSMGPTQAGSLIGSLGVPAGADLFPTQAIGYWLMVDGLVPGPHQLQFGGSINEFTVDTPVGPVTNNGFSTDTTANISVVPEPASALLVLPWLFGLPAFGRRAVATT